MAVQNTNNIMPTSFFFILKKKMYWAWYARYRGSIPDSDRPES